MRFARTAFFLWSGLLIWAADFLFIYVLAALACARGFAATEIAGVRLVPFAAMLATLLALAGTAAVMWSARQRTRRASDRDRPAEFVSFLVLALGALALLAIAWNALPVVMLSSHC